MKINKMKRISFLITILILSSISFAHSGGTDSKGGHHDRIHGGYHYHHGYPAHDICGSNCPYLVKEETKTKSEPNNTLGYVMVGSGVSLIAATIYAANKLKK